MQTNYAIQLLPPLQNSLHNSKTLAAVTIVTYFVAMQRYHGQCWNGQDHELHVGHTSRSSKLNNGNCLPGHGHLDYTNRSFQQNNGQSYGQQYVQDENKYETSCISIRKYQQQTNESGKKRQFDDTPGVFSLPFLY